MSSIRRTRGLLKRWDFSFKRLLIGFAVVVAIGVALPFGCVGNRQFNTEKDDYLRIHRTDGGVPYAVAVVEFDDQGEPWDMAQLDAAVDVIRRFNAESEHGVILHQFIHGWKSNASTDPDSGQRLAWFGEQISELAGHSEMAASRTGQPPRPAVGLFVGWRGRTYSLPILIDASFWNRRVAAHRVASFRLLEVLQRTLDAARENPDSKSYLLGHSMGGMILEKTVGPIAMAEVLTVSQTGSSVPVGYDLVVSANPSTEALYTKQLIDVLKRTGVKLVVDDGDGNRRPAVGPMMVSLTSEGDGVTRWMVPLAMTVNSVFVRYRESVPGSGPAQRFLGIRTAGNVPYLFSHDVEVRDGDVVLTERPGRWNDTPLWVFRVPRDISADHGDISSPLLDRLLYDLLERNDVFDPDSELRLAATSAVPAAGS
ncbi:MAG: hypothetical protein V2I67_18555 [Thermoanaerobaculales bacterium]|jgi:hypothetical protein|nr:hypothetical protein [Thermoanaerobaculales bacterium]